TSLSITNGQLVAAGTVAATIKKKTTTVPFSGVPGTVALDPAQVGPAARPLLGFSLGPLNLHPFGLVGQTSPICIKITAFDGGGLLGDLLCSIANLLNTGLPLDQILAGLSTSQLNSLLTGLTDLLNNALARLSDAVLGSIDLIEAEGTCA